MPTDELAVPAQDRSQCDEQAEASVGREQSGKGGDQGAVGPAHPRAWRAPSKHGELVAQNQDSILLVASDSARSTIQLRSLANIT